MCPPDYFRKRTCTYCGTVFEGEFCSNCGLCDQCGVHRYFKSRVTHGLSGYHPCAWHEKQEWENAIKKYIEYNGNISITDPEALEAIKNAALKPLDFREKIDSWIRGICQGKSDAISYPGTLYIRILPSNGKDLWHVFVHCNYDTYINQQFRIREDENAFVYDISKICSIYDEHFKCLKEPW